MLIKMLNENGIQIMIIEYAWVLYIYLVADPSV